MVLKQKLILAFTCFIMLIFVLGVWVYIMIDNVQYKPAAPSPVSDTVGKGSETKVSIEQKTEEELQKIIDQASSQTAEE